MFFDDPTTAAQPMMSVSALPVIPTWYKLLSVVSGVLSGYHGYRRNHSIGWGIGWFALGSLFPVITPTIAVAQGFGKRK